MGSVDDAVEQLFHSSLAPAPPPRPTTTKSVVKVQPNRSYKRPADGPQPGPSKQRASQKRVPPRKGRYTKQDGKSVTYDKSTLPGARLMYQRTAPFRVLCSNVGANAFCEILFQSIHFRDFRTAANVSVHQLKYVTVIALWARAASVSVDAGYIPEDVPELSHLIKSVKGLQLPALLAKYVESIGLLTLSSGVRIAPWFSYREHMQNPRIDHLNPDDFLLAADRPIPDNYWSIDRSWIMEWNIATTRPARLGMHFRHLNWSEISGTPEMVVTPIVSRFGEEYLTPTAPQQLTDVEAQTGAIYRWRNFEQLRHWPEQTALVCTRLYYGTEFFPVEEIGIRVVGSFTSSE